MIIFDRYTRNEKHFYKTIEYIENNPVKAGLCEKPSDWPFSGARWRGGEGIRICSRCELICGRDARGPSSSPEWFRLGLRQWSICRRDARD